MSREKQIEELTNELVFTSNYGTYDAVATYLVNKGYRKQSENTIELPCKIGDTVYRVKKRRGVWCVLPREVVSITYRLDHLYRIVWEIFSTEMDTLGKDVFLTEEEAERALAKMKGGTLDE